MESSIDLLKMLIAEGEKFTFENFSIPNEHGMTKFGGEDTGQWSAWKARTSNLVKQLTGVESPNQVLVQQALGMPTKGNFATAFIKVKENLLLALRMTLKALEEDTFGELRSNRSISNSPALSNKVFIVHGHDTALKTDVEQFLLQIGLEPVVLHRQPDKGQTLIEKFEEHSDVGFAFILLTPDEIAYTIAEEGKVDKERSKEKRARPNVIFEFGYFVGKLGRSRVCCLYKEGVDLPSDLNGLVYKKIDGSIESQAMSIIKELKAAGYTIRL